MNFFDFKFILIILLALLVYFLYKKINTLNYKIDKIYNNELILHQTDDHPLFPNFDSRKNKINKSERSELLNIVESLTNFNENPNNLFNIGENSNNLINIVDNLTNFPENIIGGCVIKTINIPLSKKPQIINIPHENLSEIKIIDHYEQDLKEIVDTNCESEKINTNCESEIVNTNCESEKIDTNCESEKEIINTNCESEKEIVDSFIKSPDVQLEQKESINQIESPEYVSKKHIEIYSNENTPIESTNIEITKISKSYDDILKNINKYKLPELQDLAIEYKIDISNSNNKKKSKEKLTNDIKKFILNKNI